MKVKEIQELLDRVSEEAELTRVWIKNTGTDEDGLRHYKTTLYFNDNGVHSQVQLFTKTRARLQEETPDVGSKTAKPKGPTLGDKFKDLFRRTDNDLSNALQEDQHRENSGMDDLVGEQHV